MTDRTTVRNGDTHLSVLVTGQPDGPTVLLSNSLGAGLHMWDPQRDLLNPHFRVIGYDTRGHGMSGTPSGSYSFGDLTADAIAILDHFEAERADIIGLSLGGMTALGLGLDYPDRVGRIVCACARADAPQPFVTSWDDRIAAITAGGMSAIWQGTLDRWLTRDVISSQPQTVTALAADFMATTVSGYTGCARALQQLDYRRRLPGMTAAVTYIAGADDMGAPPAAMQEMAQATPGSQYVEIPDCAHIANVNRADSFNAVLQNFLEISFV